ncbi:glycosyltransferase family 2 protein [Pseudomonas sp. C9-3]|uniref:glycosyltransferase family 2 protein n=1 Tax=Pseudomonas sp. C9-3 TaxID=3078264 RepID=UPI0028EC81F6|nr:glycosyltransferase family 2 protein [Pseudomonas sp. C9-3]
MANPSEKPLLSLVIPLYREASHFASSLREIVAVLESIPVDFEIVLVDDGSPDETWSVIQQQCIEFPQVKAARLSRNFGKEAALAAGLEHVSGDAVVVMDGDLQHPPSLIVEMLKHWQEGAEVIEAVKQQRAKESLAGRLSSRLFYSVFSRLTGFDLRGASDFKLMDRKVINAWRRMGERNLFFRGMNAWLGFKRVQVQYNVDDRVDGQSGWSVIQLVRLAVTAVASFSSIPLYFLIFAGFGFSVFALVLGVQTLIRKIDGYAIDGFTTVILLLLIIGSGMMFGLGLIGIYIARIYEEVKKRPRYIIAEWVGDAR